MKIGIVCTVQWTAQPDCTPLQILSALSDLSPGEHAAFVFQPVQTARPRISFRSERLEEFVVQSVSCALHEQLYDGPTPRAVETDPSKGDRPYLRQRCRHLPFADCGEPMRRGLRPAQSVVDILRQKPQALRHARRTTTAARLKRRRSLRPSPTMSSYEAISRAGCKPRRSSTPPESPSANASTTAPTPSS
jgi:hypothetical protein